MQGIDTAGKGGVTKHALGPLSPVGVQYTGFKAPSKAELRHDFLWRIRKKLPAPGVLGVFDRSHYEDVLIARVHDLVPESEWDQRYDIINDFEAELVDTGTTVLKIFLNISFDTQRERLLRRLDRDDKHWKFNEGDIDERAYWAQYQVAFDAMLERCNTAHAPWFIVPSDHKKYRNWAVGELLTETMDGLDLRYPQPSLDIAVVARATAATALNAAAASLTVRVRGGCRPEGLRGRTEPMSDQGWGQPQFNQPQGGDGQQQPGYGQPQPPAYGQPQQPGLRPAAATWSTGSRSNLVYGQPQQPVVRAAAATWRTASLSNLFTASRTGRRRAVGRRRA